MNDPRIGPLRQQLECDLRLSPQAKVAMFSLYSDRIRDRKRRADAEFPFPWTLIKRWTGLSSKSRCKEIKLELAHFGYIYINGSTGAPPTSICKLNFKMELHKLIAQGGGIIPPLKTRFSKMSPATIKRHIAALKAAAA